ncbi:hypothetical protein [Nitrosopumilus sp. b1]|uniref:hypothetical protein n=1 Tax=Nitrosopumilus sp. b1 TaxID=2109907 RepID=UPI0015F74CEF|nr:hypothetical protein [Nitrosopumilus sp. b1]
MSTTHDKIGLLEEIGSKIDLFLDRYEKDIPPEMSRLLKLFKNSFDNMQKDEQEKS